MIELLPTFNAPAVLEYFHHKDVVTAQRGLSTAPAACCFSSCGLDVPQFANLNDQFNTRENDFFNFSQELPEGYTITAHLLDLKTGDEFLIDDDTYGSFADIGTIAAKPDLWGFVINWFKVADELQFGKYQLRSVVKNGASTTIRTDLSVCFNLQSFDCDTADKTVRISVAQSGFIQDRFDWTGIEGNLSASPGAKLSPYGNYQIRLRGILKRTGEPVESDFIATSDRRSSLVQKLTFSTWTLRLDWVEYIISDMLLKEMFLANPILIDDYNQDNITTFDKVELTHLTNDDPEKFIGLKDEFFNINFEDFRKSNIKRYR